MGKTKPKERIQAPTDEQLLTGEFDKTSVTHVDDVQTTSQAYRRRQTRSALTHMNERGSLSDEQLLSAREIALIAEYLQRSVESRCASMEARVDCSGSANGALNESLRMMRLEGAYSEWRTGLPLPRRMVIDMVLEDNDMRGIAKRYGKSWHRTARQMLKDELDRWPALAKKYHASIRHDDKIIAHARLSA